MEFLRKIFGKKRKSPQTGAEFESEDLFSSLKVGDLERAKKILSINPEHIHARDDQDDTPLHWAVQEGDYLSTLYLIESGADVNAKSVMGKTPLHHAIERGYNTGQKEHTTEHNVEKVVQILIDAGADVNAKTPRGQSVLRTAMFCGYDDLVVLLKKSGASL